MKLESRYQPLSNTISYSNKFTYKIILVHYQLTTDELDVIPIEFRLLYEILSLYFSITLLAYFASINHS